MTYWVCFEPGRASSPWIVRSAIYAKPESRRRAYSKYSVAHTRVKRLRTLWPGWRKGS